MFERWNWAMISLCPLGYFYQIYDAKTRVTVLIKQFGNFLFKSTRSPNSLIEPINGNRFQSHIWWHSIISHCRNEIALICFDNMNGCLMKKIELTFCSIKYSKQMYYYWFDTHFQHNLSFKFPAIYLNMQKCAIFSWFKIQLTNTRAFSARTDECQSIT